MLADSLARVARLERAVAEDRNAVHLARERLRLAALALLSQPETVVGIYVVGALAGVAGPDVGRRVFGIAVRLAGPQGTRKNRG